MEGWIKQINQTTNKVKDTDKQTISHTHSACVCERVKLMVVLMMIKQFFNLSWLQFVTAQNKQMVVFHCQGLSFPPSNIHSIYTIYAVYVTHSTN